MGNESRPASNSLRTRLSRLVRGLSSDPMPPHPVPEHLILKTTVFSSFKDFASYYQNMTAAFKAKEQYQLQLITGAESFTAPGYCFPCATNVNFMIDYHYSGNEEVDGLRIPNWRERVTCPHCHLNNRIRASVQFLEETLGCSEQSSIYITEQTTALHGYLKAKYKNITGSEYLGDRVKFGEIEPESGLRNESITKLSFADNTFDFVLSFDVFEHVPEYHKALRECFRVLKPGGRLLFTVPFRMDNQANLIRATMDAQGNVEHLMEPEYHGDPINDAGCLCFYHFGWQLLDELKGCGFRSATAHVYWSDTLGYLGLHQSMFCAAKAPQTLFGKWLSRFSQWLQRS